VADQGRDAAVAERTKITDNRRANTATPDEVAAAE
jgi:hypothetical protein